MQNTGVVGDPTKSVIQAAYDHCFHKEAFVHKCCDRSISRDHEAWAKINHKQCEMDKTIDPIAKHILHNVVKHNMVVKFSDCMKMFKIPKDTARSVSFRRALMAKINMGRTPDDGVYIARSTSTQKCNVRPPDMIGTVSALGNGFAESPLVDLPGDGDGVTAGFPEELKHAMEIVASAVHEYTMREQERAKRAAADEGVAVNYVRTSRDILHDLETSDLTVNNHMLMAQLELIITKSHLARGNSRGWLEANVRNLHDAIVLATTGICSPMQDALGQLIR